MYDNVKSKERPYSLEESGLGGGITLRNRISQWVIRNTLINFSLIALCKAGLILIALLIGLFTYQFEEEAFYRALFLYALPAFFDLAMKYRDISQDDRYGLFIRMETLLLTIVYMALFLISLLGMFDSSLYLEMKVYKFYINMGIYSQVGFYTLEFILHAIRETLGGNVKQQ